MRVRKVLEDVRSSLWFVPGTIVIASIALAFLLVEVEWTSLSNALRNVAPRFFSTNADDARQLLSTIATSILTVAGVTFSVTAVTLSLIASQYTPRVVRTFMRSHKTQVALGVLMGVYAYAIIVLRTVGGGQTPHVPSIAVNFANLYVLVGLLVFIMFVHHIASFIQPATIATGVFAETLKAIRETYPEELPEGEDQAESDADDVIAQSSWHTLPAPKAGYIEEVDCRALVRHGSRTGNAVRLAKRVGEFVVEGEPILCVANAAPDKSSSRRLIAAVTLGVHRTIEQDPGFGVRQLVDMALKGLSPAINDPTTAMLCIDHLAALLHHMSRRRSILAHRGRDGRIHAIVPRPEFNEILGNAIAPLCLAAAQHPQVLERLMCTLTSIARELPRGMRRRETWAQAIAVADQVGRLGPVPGRGRVVASTAQLRKELDTRVLE